LPSRTAIDEGPQQRKVICQVFQHPLEIALQPRHVRSHLCVAPIAPLGELPGDDFLNGLAVGEVRGTTRAAGPDEVVLAERKTPGEIRRFDHSGDVCTRGGREPEPIPSPLDDLSECTDGNAFTIG
jgi:hypothetical protein